jgi:predicted permease
MHIDWRVLGFAIVIAALTGIAFGLMQALFSARTDVNRALKLGSASASSDRSRRRLRDGLIVAEIVLSLVLLVGASFFVRGLVRITHRDLGWNPDGLVTGAIALPYSKFKDDESCQQFIRRLEAELAALPGVQHAALATAVPTFGTAPQFVSPESPAAGTPPNPVPASMNDVSPDYFGSAGIALVRGRAFTPADRQGAPAVAIINETMARLLWPGQDPLGRRVNVGGNNRPGPHEIVGVVRDSQPATNFTPNQAMEIYRPIAQAPTHWPALLVRAAGEPATIVRSLRTAVQRIDPDLAILNLSTARADVELVGSSTRTISFAVSFFSAFGLLLAALGVYGVIARLVHQRTREIGVRLALGAAPGDVLMLVLRHGMRLALLGCALGVAGGFGAVRLCAAIVPGYPGVDWFWFSAVVLGLLAITLVACWLPARRATRVNPIVALRAE